MRRTAFTLVELSIVLIIIGLIVGGVLVGRDMIHTAGLQKVITEVQQYQAAVNVFRGRYGELPGDYRGAYAAWGATAGCTNVYVGSNPAGCNGNGDKMLAYNSGEVYRAWQHLSLAELVPGNYTGTATSNEGVLGVNVPPSKVGGGGYTLVYSAGSPMSNVVGFNLLQLGRPTANNRPSDAIFAPADAQYIDQKMDDGMPGKGAAFGDDISGFTGTCFTGANPNMTYTVSNPGLACTMYFKVGSN